MTITATQFITDALTELGVLAEGDTPSTQMLNDGLRSLNRLLDYLSNDQSFAYFPNLLSWNVTGEPQFYIGPALTGSFTVTIANPAVFTATAHGLVAGDTVTLATTGALPTGLAAATTYYVISTGLTANAFELSATSGGAAIITTGTQSGTHTFTQTSSLTKLIAQRPIGIESAYATRNGINYPIRVIDNQLWDSIIYQAAAGANTSFVWYEAQLPNGILHVWPLVTGCSVNLRVVNQVVNFADLTTPVSLPPGYEECITSNLAVRLSPQYPSVQLSPITLKYAKSSLDIIRRRNNVIPTMTLPGVVTTNRGGFSYGNFLSGSF